MARQKHRDATIHLKLEHLEARQLLAADLFTEGSVSFATVDIDQDGVVGPLDAIPMVNTLNQGPLQEQDALQSVQFDINGDGQFSALDVLLVINRFGERRRGSDYRPGGPGNRPGGPHGGPGTGEPPPLPSRSIDGIQNNARHPEWGSAGQQLLRLTTAEYADGLSEPAGGDRLSAREISNVVAAQSESILNDRGLSDLVWQWGQFIDHDLALTEGADPAEPFPIEVPAGDPYFDPFNTGTQMIDLSRSGYETSADNDAARQQVNLITAYIDGSNVYGSDEDRAAALRTFEGGQLKTSEGNLLPFNVDGFDNAGGPSEMLFLAGDVRANEQVGLTAMHTLWVREHNRIATELANQNPQATDQHLYQRARAIVIGEMQAITYNEFLPALLGKEAIAPYQGYDPQVDAGISNVFSTAAYRFGHSMLSSELLRLNSDGSIADEGPLALRDAFFNPSELSNHGIESLLVGLANQQAQEIDTMLVDDVRNFLFGPPGSGGFDLASLNIQRGRDHGLADYNQVREDLGLDRVTSFDQITSDPAVQIALAAAYPTVDDIDAWVGGLAEDHVRGASVGELVRAVLVDQFTRLRDGDSFWYQRVFRGRELRMIENTRLSDVIQRNTDITGLQRNAFFVPRDPIQTHVKVEPGNQAQASGHRPSRSGPASDVAAGGTETGLTQRPLRHRTRHPASHPDTARDGDEAVTDLVFADETLLTTPS